MKETVRVVNFMSRLNPLGQVALSLFVLSVPGLATAQTDSFDVPLKKKVVDFGQSPYYPGGNVRIKLSCYFYSTFMVKEYDDGQKGAEWLAIVPVEARTTPACTRSHAEGERVIEEPEWGGYFKGAKRNLVFFHAADGTNGGMPFAVYDARTGTKVFQDSYYDASIWHRKVEKSPFNRLRVSNAPNGQVLLIYLRVVEADCDLHSERVSCWKQVRKKLEVKSIQAPVCSGYKHVTTRWTSAIAYPVEVSLFPQPITKTVDGPVKCRPVD